jgi:electron transfer flavoprotein alpha subunit
MTATGEILFYCETVKGTLHRSVPELSALGRSLADGLGKTVAALLFTEADADGLTRDLVSYGVDRVYVAADPVFETWQPEAVVAAIEQVCRDIDPEILLLGHTLRGVELAPRLAWRLDAPLATDCVEFGITADTQTVSAVRPVYGSKGLAVMTGNTRPFIATVRSKAVQPAEKDAACTGEIVPLQLKLDPNSFRIKYISSVVEEAQGPGLEDAEVVISGGRGVGKAENFSLLEELATALGGVVGGSRVAVDNKWLPSSRQVGLTGTMVSPRLYVAVGISGATQHMAGCARSQYIVAINTDPDAPIFQRAHFGVVGDFKQVLPRLIKLCQ